MSEKVGSDKLGSDKPARAPANPPAGIGDSSVGAMDGVIASIRQAMRDGEPLATGSAEPVTARGADGVLRLDPSMLISEPSPAAAAAIETSPPAPEPAARTQPGLVSDATARAAVASLAELKRAGGSGGGGLTVEAMVREALAPMLAAWLEQNLPGLVERIVRAEVERIMERS